MENAVSATRVSQVPASTVRIPHSTCRVTGRAPLAALHVQTLSVPAT